MQNSKNISVQYFKIEAFEEDYFSNFAENMETCMDLGNTRGTFESGQLAYVWEIKERVNISSRRQAFLIALAKQKKLYPNWITENDEISELSIPGMLGDLGYCLIVPDSKFVIVYGGAGGFKKLLGQFSTEGLVRLIPFLEENIDEKVLAWSCFKKLAFSISATTSEEENDFMNSKSGQLVKVLSYLGGLGLDVSVNAGKGKEMLATSQVKELLSDLIAEDLCKSLIVKGSDFEDAKAEQYDIKNAQIKYKETLEFEGNYITESDIKQVFMRALNERHSMLFDEHYDETHEQVSIRKPNISKSSSKEEMKAEIDRVEVELIDEYPHLSKQIHDAYDKERRRWGVEEVQS